MARPVLARSMSGGRMDRMPGNRATVLVIGEAAVCATAVARLEGGGYTVVCALGMAALALAQQLAPVAILLDPELAGRDGMRLGRLLRAHPRTARIPIVTRAGDADRSGTPSIWGLPYPDVSHPALSRQYRVIFFVS